MDLDQRAGDMDFSMYDHEYKPLVEGVTQFQYMFSTLKHTDNDWP